MKGCSWPIQTVAGQFRLYIDFLLALGALGEREAISLAPRLQPGGQVLQMIPEPFPTVSPDLPDNKNR
jgi:hypothetical protein